MNFHNDNEKIKIKQIKPKDKYENIKSDYFIQKVFNNYKEYSEIYSLIEIEIKPANNKYGKFINISEENKKYYHIYFNNNKEEIKINHLDKNEIVKAIKIIIDNQVKSFRDLFDDCKCIESINFKKFYRNNITNMYSMFSECTSLKELNLNNFNTNNVTNMSHMFSKCSSLED